ncbi:putative ABC transport system ATP-binding protein [Sporobacter termitidis DSM 10068]|uniref:Putative ABC transport system ATP-binding protein n=1 Tax=Sporobacter termitidis DSM 10068 TaxID=1123282 RepID=A0A1M5VHB5_9FIRM|nr:ABC transporter ATP-binding protein [Sporobacter termitidis]SHH74682.1 putative ABC transport system ATP-binding protein [Sporobacter termitidis DSM 10068]
MLLEVKDLTKEYQRGKAPFKAIDRVNLSVSSGDFVSIIGRSGSGKSTLLNLIAGLLSPTSGSIEADGQDILSYHDKAASLYRNSKIGYVPQGHSVLANLTVLDNVRLPFYFFKRAGGAEEKALSLLGQVGIPHLAPSYPKELSGGELRRVSIARALINDPGILIADEPTSDLDTQTTAEIMGLFRRISGSGTAVLMVTHELDTVDYGNRVLTMASGRLTERVK